MLSADNSALVAGGAATPAGSAVTVRIVRAVMLGGRCIGPGIEVAVDRHMAAQLVTSGKAERVAAPAQPAPETKPAAKPAKEKPRAQQ